jgi:ABC-type Zn uptake system ZnuABC Zn-binding protein ZnuA
LFCLSLLIWLAACRPTSATSTSQPGDAQPLKVVATTTILGDVAHKVGGQAIDLTVLLPEGGDPHTYQPTPQDLIKVANADLVLINGAGLESFLDRLLENAGKDKIVSVSEGITLRQLQADHPEAGAQPGADAGGQTTGIDPHVWFDPQNVKVWVDNIEREMSARSPANAAIFATKAQAYQAELDALDTWIRDQVASIPPEHRKLVTDHQNLGYFADRYGFEQVGAVIPSFSAAAEPSAEELAALENTIQAQGVPAIFIGTTVSPNLAQRVAADTGAHLVTLYTDALTAPGGEAGSYLDLMRYDVGAIVEALQ